MPSVLQHASAVQSYTSGTSGTITPAFASNTTAGSCLAACISVSVSVNATPVVTSVTTNGSAENWAQSAEDADETVFIWTGPATAGGQQAIPVAFTFGQTATTSDTVSAMADIFEIGGVASPGPVDRVSTDFLAPGGSSSWTSGTTAATRSPSQVWLACAWIGSYLSFNSPLTVTPPGSPWTTTTVLQTTVQVGGTGTGSRNFAYQACGYQVVSATGTATFAGTSSATAFWSAAVVTLKAAPLRPLSLNLGQAVKTASLW